LACMDPKKHNKSLPAGRQGIHLVIGSGGFEEGVLAAVAAKALQAVGEGRGWSGDEKIQKRYTKIWQNNDLVSGKLADCLVSVSAITDEDKWFGLKGVRVKREGESAVTTLTVDISGVNIDTKIHY